MLSASSQDLLNRFYRQAERLYEDLIQLLRGRRSERAKLLKKSLRRAKKRAVKIWAKRETKLSSDRVQGESPQPNPAGRWIPGLTGERKPKRRASERSSEREYGNGCKAEARVAAGARTGAGWHF